MPHSFNRIQSTVFKILLSRSTASVALRLRCWWRTGGCRAGGLCRNPSPPHSCVWWCPLDAQCCSLGAATVWAFIQKDSASFVGEYHEYKPNSPRRIKAKYNGRKKEILSECASPVFIHQPKPQAKWRRAGHCQLWHFWGRLGKAPSFWQLLVTGKT